ncbi:MAG: DUF4162 domain-containing protein [Thermoplasmata archaeon]|nr:DUF4162 domain-containing protein [Thermoplasmata archaeon]
MITLSTTGSETDLTGTVQALPGVGAVQRQDGTYRIKSSNGETLIPGLVQVFASSGVRLASVSLKRPSLDEVFLEFTGRAFREDEGPTPTDRAVMMRRFQARAKR